MPTLYRVDAVLSFDAPVDAADVRRLLADLDLPAPVLPDGEDDPTGSDVRVDEDGGGADLVVLVEAEDDSGARELVQAALEAALGRSGGTRDGARLDSLRASAAYDL
ncbi:hypothetical protein WDZ17_15880 [Pseudokineococcus basanitobsidens]|uniref:Uncharacterized protein n=1 Tax=Pseudokineococcus basanitobsidens TaxID=1926649 RepID=A0ABU8RNV8_9ACTN